MDLFNQIPIELVFLFTIIFSLFAAEMGYRLGLILHRHNPELRKDSSTGVLISALLGLLAFLLAFSTSYTLEQFQTRRVAVIADANAIGTAYLRAAYLDEPEKTEARELLGEYIDLRLSSDDLDDLNEILIQTDAIQNRLWDIAVEEGRSNPTSVIIGLYGTAINDMLDVHTSRVAVITGSRLPNLMWIMLYTIVFVSFLLVGVSSSAEGKRNYLTLILFSLGFAVVLWLITDLDRPDEGFLQIGQTALKDLQQQIGNVGR